MATPSYLVYPLKNKVGEKKLVKFVDDRIRIEVGDCRKA